ncbi:right-handed parallel beta-helix repeat-containing protein [Streptomyces sp. NPDC056210]|uniref:right-handed parallel beta-helix repeat-containing protein n=1 Tax=Streptomyces sp. NPDC056210 TaxID=3345746 RepID=UPI0035DF4F40
MDSYVNFQDDAYYPADKFRRMIARTQDSVTGFDGIDSFKPSATSNLLWAIEVAAGKALVSDGQGGTFWVEKSTPTQVPTQGIIDGYVIVRVLDEKAGDSVNALVLDAIALTAPMPPRSLTICKFHDTGDGVRMEDDLRYKTPGQFVVSPSGPARWGPPVDGMGLGQFSPGSQYTSLDDGVRWIKKESGAWVRSDAGAGSIDSVNGNFGPNVVLNAANVGAVPATIPMLVTNNKSAASDTAKFQGFGSGYTAITGDGAIYSNVETILRDLRLGGSNASLAGGAGGVLGFGNATTEPTGNPTGALLFSKGGKLHFKNNGGQATPLGMSLGAFDVTAYGAKGDGATDDAPSIQAALNAARDAGGGTVWVPVGTYKLTTLPLRIYQNTHLLLANGATMKRGDVVKTMLLNGNADAYAYDGQGNIIVEGGVWDMVASTATTPAMCLSFGHAKNIRVLNTEIRNVPGYHGIEFNSIHTGVVRGCRFEGYKDTGGRDFSEAIQIDLAKSVSVFGGFGYYDRTPCMFITVTDCYFGEGWPRGVGSHSAVDGKTHKVIHIEGNYFYRTNSMAVSSYNWEHVTIANNVVDDCGAGIRIKNTDASKPADTEDSNGAVTNRSQGNLAITIASNVFRNLRADAPAIRVAGDQDTDGTTRHIQFVTITGNTITSTTGTGDNGIGIRLDRVADAVINGNTVNSTGDAGIMATYGFNVVISDNVVNKSGDFGIVSRMVSLSKIQGNIVRDANDYGILVSGGSNAQVIGNFVRTAKTYGIRVSGYDADGSGPGASIPVSDVVMVGNTTTGSYTVGISISATTGTSRRYGNDARGSTIEDWSDVIYSNPKDTNSAAGKG